MGLRSKVQEPLLSSSSAQQTKAFNGNKSQTHLYLNKTLEPCSLLCQVPPTFEVQALAKRLHKQTSHFNQAEGAWHYVTGLLQRKVKGFQKTRTTLGQVTNLLGFGMFTQVCTSKPGGRRTSIYSNHSEREEEGALWSVVQDCDSTHEEMRFTLKNTTLKLPKQHQTMPLQGQKPVQSKAAQKNNYTDETENKGWQDSIAGMVACY